MCIRDSRYTQQQCKQFITEQCLWRKCLLRWFWASKIIKKTISHRILNDLENRKWWANQDFRDSEIKSSHSAITCLYLFKVFAFIYDRKSIQPRLRPFGSVSLGIAAKMLTSHRLHIVAAKLRLATKHAQVATPWDRNDPVYPVNSCSTQISEWLRN